MNELRLCAKDFNPQILFAYKKTKSKTLQAETAHAHDFLCISYIVSGSALYIIDGKDYIATQGDVVVMNAGATHCHKVNGDEFSAFDMGIADFKRHHLPMNHFIESDQSPIISLLHNEAAFYDCYREILQLQLTKDIGWKLMVKSLIMKGLVLLLQEAIPHSSASKSGYLVFDSYDKEAITDSILNYIQDNYQSKITLDNLTRNSYLSSVYISKVFKEMTGETPIQYLIKHRMNMARELIGENILSLKEIAIEVGYEDYYYFSKLFKKNFGVSPSHYRQAAG